MRNRRACGRSGTILPLLMVSLAALCGFVALAVDIGQIALARTQCQNAADAAALAGARALDGSATANTTLASATALGTATANHILSQPIDSSEVAVQHGAYHYDYEREAFSPQFPPQPPDHYNLTQVTITHRVNMAWAWIFGIWSVNVSATAVATHRPRDVCLLMDYSGSLNEEGDLWNTDPRLGSLNNTSNNTDPIYPRFGWYDPRYSPQAGLLCVPTSSEVGKCNLTQAAAGMPPLVNDFYQNASSSALPMPAFFPAPPHITSTSPGGDPHPCQCNSKAPARCWQEITGSSSLFFMGYGAGSEHFHGWTQGPGFWGKTFFLWPPDPTTDPDGNPRDWRKRFFFLADGVTPNNDDTKLPLTGANNTYPDPPGSYVINYRAILAWIRAHCVQQRPDDGNPFPPRLRAGNILYYDQIPSDVPASAYDHRSPNSQIADANQRFWKEYIDYVLGVWRDPQGKVHHAATPGCSIGGDFPCCTLAKDPAIQLTGPDGSGSDWMAWDHGSAVPFINPTDNPQRPRHRFWFGPLTLIQFLSDTGLLPGTAHDLSTYSTKMALAGALHEQLMTHCGDQVSLIFFSRPQYAEDSPDCGVFNAAQVSLCQDQARLTHALWLPPGLPGVDVRPWDPAAHQVPHVHGDFSADRAVSYGFMLAYNQLSGNSSLRERLVGGQPTGGLGRRGAERLVILVSNGMANVSTLPLPAFTNDGPGQSYYNILPEQTVHSGLYSDENLLQVVQAIGNNADGTSGKRPGYISNPGYPGYGTNSRPVRIHTIGFGSHFENDSAEQTSTVHLLQQISQLGGTVFPDRANDPFAGYKWCIGSPAERQARLQQALTTIFNEGPSVVLVR